jgi:hypothetical protein
MRDQWTLFRCVRDALMQRKPRVMPPSMAAHAVAEGCAPSGRQHVVLEMIWAMRRFFPSLFTLGFCLALAGCGALLPRSTAEDVSPFQSYEAARDAFERLRPYHASLADLQALGFDVRSSTNVQQVPYPQWVGLLVHPNVAPERADIGIRDCLAAEQACQAYVFRFGKLEHERKGSFLPDFFNFRRVTRTHGWRFEGVVLVREELVLFRNHGGQPKIELIDHRSNPLGPFQGMGETAPREAIP